jgi:hypothetical protein
MSASSERMPARQLGELMTELGLISEEQLATVLEVQQRSKRPLGQIIVELGFASGAAVAHALAMQSGGALRTEFGFALGVGPAEQGDDEGDETSTGLPKLRLAATAAQPRVSRAEETPVEEPPTDSAERDEPSEEPVAQAASEPVEVEPVEEAVEVAEIETETVEDAEPQPEDVPLEEVA